MWQGTVDFPTLSYVKDAQRRVLTYCNGSFIYDYCSCLAFSFILTDS